MNPSILKGSVRIYILMALLASALTTVVALLFSALAAGATSGDAECLRWRTVFAGMPVRQVTIETSRGLVVLPVKVADTPERQAAGFQCATRQEIQQTLILFDFGEEILTQFHMQNVPAPLDIAFAKTDGRVFAMLHMAPSPTALYNPLGPFRYALEARAGFFTANGITAGMARLLSTPKGSRLGSTTIAYRGERKHRVVVPMQTVQLGP